MTNILVVEDEAIIAMELCGTLQKLGYEVLPPVNSGDDAIKQVEEGNVDLVLMDIRIQGDKDGVDTAEIIRQRFQKPVIFTTAYLDKERIERAKLTMPFGYVLKPIQRRDLEITIEMAIYVSQVDEKRRQLEDVFKRVFEQNPDPVLLYDQSRTFKRMNQAWEDVLGYSVEELISRPLVELIHPDDQQQSIEKFHDGKKIKPDYKLRARYRHKNGSYRMLEWRESPAADGIKFATARDITDQTKREEAFRATIKKYAQLFEYSIDGQLLIDPKTKKIVDCNEEFSKISHLDKATLVQQPEDDVVQITPVLADSGSGEPDWTKGCLCHVSFAQSSGTQKFTVFTREIDLSGLTLQNKVFRSMN